MKLSYNTGPEKPLEKNESTPVKARKSLSPTKQKRRSFQTPRRSPKDVGYTPPVTRLSAKKGTPVTVSGSVSRLQEIGENSLLRYEKNMKMFLYQFLIAVRNVVAVYPFPNCSSLVSFL